MASSGFSFAQQPSSRYGKSGPSDPIERERELARYSELWRNIGLSRMLDDEFVSDWFTRMTNELQMVLNATPGAQASLQQQMALLGGPSSLGLPTSQSGYNGSSPFAFSNAPPPQPSSANTKPQAPLAGSLVAPLGDWTPANGRPQGVPSDGTAAATTGGIAATTTAVADNHAITSLITDLYVGCEPQADSYVAKRRALFRRVFRALADADPILAPFYATPEDPKAKKPAAKKAGEVKEEVKVAAKDEPRLPLPAGTPRYTEQERKDRQSQFSKNISRLSPDQQLTAWLILSFIRELRLDANSETVTQASALLQRLLPIMSVLSPQSSTDATPSTTPTVLDEVDTFARTLFKQLLPTALPPLVDAATTATATATAPSITSASTAAATTTATTSSTSSSSSSSAAAISSVASSSSSSSSAASESVSISTSAPSLASLPSLPSSPPPLTSVSSNGSDDEAALAAAIAASLAPQAVSPEPEPAPAAVGAPATSSATTSASASSSSSSSSATAAASSSSTTSSSSSSSSSSAAVVDASTSSSSVSTTIPAAPPVGPPVAPSPPTPLQSLLSLAASTMVAHAISRGKLSGILDVVEKLLSSHNDKTEELKLSCVDALGSLVDEGDPSARGHNSGRVLYHDVGTSGRTGPGSGSAISGSYAFSRGITSSGVQELPVNIRHMATGDHHSVVIGDDNKVYVMGQNNEGELGNLATPYFSSLSPLPIQTSIGLPSVGVSKVACGHNFTLFLSNAATVYSMGSSCLGHRQSGPVYLPTLIKDTENVTVMAIGCGRQAAFAITADGNVLAWGANTQGQLGLGNQTSQTRPQPITSLLGKNVEMITGGTDHTICLTSEGHVYTWGGSSSSKAMLGHGPQYAVQKQPRQVTQGLIGKKVVYVAAGHEYSMAVVNDGSVWAWGLNGSGQLGMGHSMDQNTPQKLRTISVDGKDQKVVSVSCGRASTIFLTEEGHVLVSGESLFGLPASTRPIRVPPALLTNGGRATMASLGEKFAMAFVEPGPKIKRKSLPLSLQTAIPEPKALLAAGGILQHPIVAGLMPDDDDDTTSTGSSSAAANANPWSVFTDGSPRSSVGGDNTSDTDSDDDAFSSDDRRSPRSGSGSGSSSGRGGSRGGGRGTRGASSATRGGRGGGRGSGGYYGGFDDLPRAPSGGGASSGNNDQAGVSFWGSVAESSAAGNLGMDADFEAAIRLSAAASQPSGSGSGPSSPSRSPRLSAAAPSASSAASNVTASPGFSFAAPSLSPSFPGISLPTAPLSVPPLPSSPSVAPLAAPTATSAAVSASPSPFSANGNLFSALEAASSSASGSSSASVPGLFGSSASSIATPARFGTSGSSSNATTGAAIAAAAAAAANAPVRFGGAPRAHRSSGSGRASLMSTPITFGGQPPAVPGAPVKAPAPTSSSATASSSSAKPLLFAGLPPLPSSVAQVARGVTKRTPLGAFPTALLVMGHLDRLANAYWTASLGSSTVTTSEQSSNPRMLHEPYAVEVSRISLGRLLHMANKYGHRLLDGSTDYNTIDWHHPYMFMALLRLLRTNFRRLLLSNVDMESIRGEGRPTTGASSSSSSSSSSASSSKSSDKSSDKSDDVNATPTKGRKLGINDSTPKKTESSTVRRGLLLDEESNDEKKGSATGGKPWRADKKAFSLNGLLSLLIKCMSASAPVHPSSSSSAAASASSSAAAPTPVVKDARTVFMEMLHPFAVDFVRIGLSVFYPSATDRRGLLDAIVSAQPAFKSSTAVSILLGRSGLGHPDIIRDLLPQVPRIGDDKKDSKDGKDGASDTKDDSKDNKDKKKDDVKTPAKTTSGSVTGSSSSASRPPQPSSAIYGTSSDAFGGFSYPPSTLPSTGGSSTRARSPPRATPTPAAAPKGPWACEVCTYLNDSGTRCSMCESPRPAVVAPPPAPVEDKPKKVEPEVKAPPPVKREKTIEEKFADECTALSALLEKLAEHAMEETRGRIKRRLTAPPFDDDTHVSATASATDDDSKEVIPLPSPTNNESKTKEEKKVREEKTKDSLSSDSKDEKSSDRRDSKDNKDKDSKDGSSSSSKKRSTLEVMMTTPLTEFLNNLQTNVVCWAIRLVDCEAREKKAAKDAELKAIAAASAPVPPTAAAAAPAPAPAKTGTGTTATPATTEVKAPEPEAKPRYLLTPAITTAAMTIVEKQFDVLLTIGNRAASEAVAITNDATKDATLVVTAHALRASVLGACLPPLIAGILFMAPTSFVPLTRRLWTKLTALLSSMDALVTHIQNRDEKEFVEKARVYKEKRDADDRERKAAKAKEDEEKQAKEAALKEKKERYERENKERAERRELEKLEVAKAPASQRSKLEKEFLERRQKEEAERNEAELTEKREQEAKDQAKAKAAMDQSVRDAQERKREQAIRDRVAWIRKLHELLATVAAQLTYAELSLGSSSFDDYDDNKLPAGATPKLADRRDSKGLSTPAKASDSKDKKTDSKTSSASASASSSSSASLSVIADAKERKAAEDETKRRQRELEEWLNSDLLKMGLSDSVPYRADQLQDDDDDDDDDDTALPAGKETKMLELSRRLTPRSQATVITAEDARTFCNDFIENRGVAGRFHDWLAARQRTNTGSIPSLDRAVRGRFAAIIKHHGLLAEAITYARLLADMARKKAEDKNTSVRDLPSPRWNPIVPELAAAWIEADNIRMAIQLPAQKLVSSGKYESKDKACEELCKPYYKATEFLLRVTPSIQTVQASAQKKASRRFGEKKTAKTRWAEVRNLISVLRHFRFFKLKDMMERLQRELSDRSCFSEIAKFYRAAAADSIDFNILQKELLRRSHLAMVRLQGLRRLRKLLTMVKSSTARQPLLDHLRRSLYNRNILDGIDGAGELIIEAVQKQFGRVMQDVSGILGTALPPPLLTMPGMTPVRAPLGARLAACGVWVYRVRPTLTDYQLLSSVNVVKVLHTILANSGETTDYEEQALYSRCWKIFKILATQLGQSLKNRKRRHRTSFSTTATTPQLVAIFDTLHSELERSMSKLSVYAAHLRVHAERAAAQGELRSTLHPHALIFKPRCTGRNCDGCRASLIPDTYQCRGCDFDLCQSCWESSKVVPKKTKEQEAAEKKAQEEKEKAIEDGREEVRDADRDRECLSYFQQHSVRCISLAIQLVSANGHHYLMSSKWMSTLISLVDNQGGKGSVQSSLRQNVVHLFKRLLPSIRPAAAESLLWPTPTLGGKTTGTATSSGATVTTSVASSLSSSSVHANTGDRVVRYLFGLVADSLWPAPPSPSVAPIVTSVSTTSSTSGASSSTNDRSRFVKGNNDDGSESPQEAARSVAGDVLSLLRQIYAPRHAPKPPRRGSSTGSLPIPSDDAATGNADGTDDEEKKGEEKEEEKSASEASARRAELESQRIAAAEWHAVLSATIRESLAAIPTLVAPSSTSGTLSAEALAARQVQLGNVLVALHVISSDAASNDSARQATIASSLVPVADAILTAFNAVVPHQFSQKQLLDELANDVRKHYQERKDARKIQDEYRQQEIARVRAEKAFQAEIKAMADISAATKSSTGSDSSSVASAKTSGQGLSHIRASQLKERGATISATYGSNTSAPSSSPTASSSAPSASKSRDEQEKLLAEAKAAKDKLDKDREVLEAKFKAAKDERDAKEAKEKAIKERESKMTAEEIAAEKKAEVDRKEKEEKEIKDRHDREDAERAAKEAIEDGKHNDQLTAEAAERTEKARVIRDAVFLSHVSARIVKVVSLMTADSSVMSKLLTRTDLLPQLTFIASLPARLPQPLHNAVAMEIPTLEQKREDTWSSIEDSRRLEDEKRRLDEEKRRTDLQKRRDDAAAAQRLEDDRKAGRAAAAGKDSKDSKDESDETAKAQKKAELLAMRSQFMTSAPAIPSSATGTTSWGRAEPSVAAAELSSQDLNSLLAAHNTGTYDSSDERPRAVPASGPGGWGGASTASPFGVPSGGPSDWSNIRAPPSGSPYLPSGGYAPSPSDYGDRAPRKTTGRADDGLPPRGKSKARIRQEEEELREEMEMDPPPLEPEFAVTAILSGLPAVNKWAIDDRLERETADDAYDPSFFPEEAARARWAAQASRLRSAANNVARALQRDPLNHPSGTVVAALTTVKNMDVALAILYARQAVSSLVHHWPASSLSSLNAMTSSSISPTASSSTDVPSLHPSLFGDRSFLVRWLKLTMFRDAPLTDPTSMASIFGSEYTGGGGSSRWPGGNSFRGRSDSGDDRPSLSYSYTNGSMTAHLTQTAKCAPIPPPFAVAPHNRIAVSNFARILAADGTGELTNYFVEEAFRHIWLAAGVAFANEQWGTRDLDGDSGLGGDIEVLTAPRLEMADCLLHNMLAAHPRLRNADTFIRLVPALRSSNVVVKERVLVLLTGLLWHFKEQATNGDTNAIEAAGRAIAEIATREQTTQADVESKALAEKRELERVKEMERRIRERDQQREREERLAKEKKDKADKEKEKADKEKAEKEKTDKEKAEKAATEVKTDATASPAATPAIPTATPAAADRSEVKSDSATTPSATATTAPATTGAPADEKDKPKDGTAATATPPTPSSTDNKDKSEEKKDTPAPAPVLTPEEEKQKKLDDEKKRDEEELKKWEDSEAKRYAAEDAERVQAAARRQALKRPSVGPLAAYLDLLPLGEVDELIRLRFIKENGRLFSSGYLAALIDFVTVVRACRDPDFTKVAPSAPASMVTSPSASATSSSSETSASSPTAAVSELAAMKAPNIDEVTLRSIRVSWDSTRSKDGADADAITYVLEMAYDSTKTRLSGPPGAQELASQRTRVPGAPAVTESKTATPSGASASSTSSASSSSISGSSSSSSSSSSTSSSVSLSTSTSVPAAPPMTAPVASLKWVQVYSGAGLSWNTPSSLQLQPLAHYSFRVKQVIASPASTAAATPAATPRQSSWSEVSTVSVPAQLVWDTDNTDQLGVAVFNDGLSAGRTVKSLALLMDPNIITQFISMRTKGGFSNGLHTWEFKVDHVTKATAYIGVMRRSDSKMGKPSPSMFQQWRGSREAYHIQTGDIWRLTLDCEDGSLEAHRNGRYLGVVVDNLPRLSGKDDTWYPAINFIEPNDKISLLPPAPRATKVVNDAAIATRFVTTHMNKRAPSFRMLENAYTGFTSLLTNTLRSFSTSLQSVTLEVNPSVIAAAGFTLGARVMTEQGGGRFMGLGIEEESFDGMTKRLERERVEREKKKTDSKSTDVKDAKETKSRASESSSRSIWINLDTDGPTQMRRHQILDITKEKEKPKRDAHIAAHEALTALPTLTATSSAFRLREAIATLQQHQVALQARLNAPPASKSDKDKDSKDKDSSSPPASSPTSATSSSPPAEKPGLLTRAFSGLLSGRWATASLTPAEIEEKKQVDDAMNQLTSLLTKYKEYYNLALRGMRDDELDQWTFTRFRAAMESDQWTLAKDIDLVAMVNYITSVINVAPHQLIATDFNDEVRGLSTFRSLQSFGHMELLARFALLLDFNNRVATVLPHIRHGTLGYHNESDHLWSVAARLREGRELMFQHVKQRAWDEALRATTTHSRPPNRDVLMGACSGLIDVEFNRNIAKEAREHGGRTMAQKLTQLLFGQAEGLLDDNEPDKLRRAYVKPPLFEPFDLQKRTFMVKFTGEEAHDEGGPYRACFHDWIAELQSEHLPLLIPSANKGKTDNDTWIPNPGCKRFDLFRRLGKIIGIAIRNDIPLSLNLPSLFWKKLVGLTPNRSDLRKVDLSAVLAIEEIERKTDWTDTNTAASSDASSSSSLVDELGGMLAEFSVRDFTCRLSNGTRIDLVPGGRKKLITRDNRDEWIRLFEAARINEFNDQVDAILSGLSTVIPLSLIELFTDRELEYIVCGAPDYSVAALEREATYNRYESKDTVIQHFWDVMYEMDAADRSQFLLFVRGCNRLQAQDHLVVQKLTRDKPDLALPRARTCFFELQLPQYTNRDVLRKKLKDAMYLCDTMSQE